MLLTSPPVISHINKNIYVCFCNIPLKKKTFQEFAFKYYDSKLIDTEIFVFLVRLNFENRPNSAMLDLKKDSLELSTCKIRNMFTEPYK